MLIRIVKMTFAPENIEDFQETFHRIKHKIAAFEGCELVELYQDKHDKCIFFTYSHWQSEADLEGYRNSSFFKEVWRNTKKMFTTKAEAWSVDKIVSLNQRSSM